MRDVVRTAAVAVALCSGCLVSCSPPSAQPNVLLVVLDTTRAGALSAYGERKAHTPNLDRLASEGVLFESARATSSWTLPTHATLFTGLFPFQHNAHHETDRLGEEQVTLAELMSTTHETVGFSENPHIVRAKGFAQGFERFIETWNPEDKLDPKTLDRFAEWFGQRDKRRPFFAFVNLFTPHLPYAPPQRWVDHFFTAEEKAAGGPRELRRFSDREARLVMTGDLEVTPEGLELLHRLYLADTAYADERLGQLVDALRAAGVLDDTLVVIVGDHGENIGEHGLFEHQFGLYETVLHVPMILRHPPTFEPGVRRKGSVQLTDVAATVAEIAGVSSDLVRHTAGRSLAHDDPPPTRPVLSEFFLPLQQRPIFARTAPEFDFSRFDRRLKSIQVGNEKLIVWQDGQMELYDLAADPAEQHDLAGIRPDTARRLHEQLMGIIGEWAPKPAGTAPALDEATRDRLRSLGYID